MSHIALAVETEISGLLEARKSLQFEMLVAWLSRSRQDMLFEKVVDCHSGAKS
jgi:hypothetical protein